MTDKIIIVGGGKDGLVSAVNQVMKDGKNHHLIISGDKEYLDGEEVVMRENPVFIEDEPEAQMSPKRTLRERLYKHIRMGKSAVNAPKRHTCPKCQSQAKRIRKTESNANMPAMAYYKCRCKNRFEIILKRQ